MSSSSPSKNEPKSDNKDVSKDEPKSDNKDDYDYDNDHDNDNDNDNDDSNKHKPSSGMIHVVWSLFLIVLRLVWVDFPLTVTFGAAGVAGTVQSIWSTYYISLMDRATRTDDDLYQEFTYYHRRCTARDVTTQNLTELILPTTSASSTTTTTTTTTTTVQDGKNVETRNNVDLLMRHGVVVIPNVVSPSTLQNLRQYAVFRNHHTAEHEQYPVSQGTNRISFGYDATEHPAVIQAIREVAHHSQLKALLQTVLGDLDPASTEITTITQYYGAPPQAWHSDTKEDGNALKFARTYSHSYSLFLPLQDITEAMGPTDVCPGTHYCANDLSRVCEKEGRGLHTANSDNAFHAGDGALINQHVWHRGAPHKDPDAPERVVFIMSFIARPSTTVHAGIDTRQLSRGTYFHQKWNMWGHTWRDLQDPMKSMQQPWSILKCLSIFSWNRAWGYDLVTATYMRFSNGQLGDDLTRLAGIWDNVLQWPTWLRGRCLEYQDDVTEKQAWQIFIQETIDIWVYYTQRVAWVVHGLYGTVLLVLGLVSQRFAKNGITAGKRLLMTHGFIAVALWTLLRQIQNSVWGRNVIQGRTLMRPFAPVTIATEEELETVIPTGPTTYPSTWDVLLGTRFDAPWLGSYERWLDGHPGNVLFRDSVRHLARYYQHDPVDKFSKVYQHALINTVVGKIEAMNGRFLQQDYRNGDWRIMTTDREDLQERIRLELAVAASPIKQALRVSLDRAIATMRFGTTQRSTVLARKTVVYAWKLQRRLVGIDTNKPMVVEKATVSAVSAPFSLTVRTRVKTVQSEPNYHSRRYSSSLPPQETTERNDYKVGLPVWYHDPSDQRWYLGDILDKTFNKEDQATSYIIAFENGEVLDQVDEESLVPYHAVQEGDDVMGCYSAAGYDNDEMPYPLDDCYPGNVFRVMPDGAASIYYQEDGDVSFRHPPGHYYIPPFAYYLSEGY